jgi:hypothetical protein
VDERKLRHWFATTIQVYQDYKINCDKSGKHNFSSEEEYIEFVKIFADDAKYVVFLVGAGRSCGDEALEFFNWEF